MQLTRSGRAAAREFAERFTQNRPPLCDEHAPTGLPVDECISEALHDQFMGLVTDELRRQGYNPSTVEPAIRDLVFWTMRSEFADVYRDDVDDRTCVGCYTERKNGDGVPIRMTIPDEYDDIPLQ